MALPLPGRPPSPLAFAARLPAVRTARGYRAAWLRHDLAAGLALTGILVPAGMAYADASGLPAIVGLYATIVPLLVYALIGPSRLLMLGPDSSLVPLVLVALAPFARLSPDAAMSAAAMLAVLVGAMVIAAGLARLGFLTDLLSVPARTGFMAGLAVIILSSQLPRLAGFSVEGTGPLDRLPAFVAGLRDGLANPAALVLGLAALALILVARARRPSLPGVLAAVVAMTVISALLDLAGHFGVPVVGVLPTGLPAFAPPLGALGEIPALLPAAVGIALVTATDTVVLSRTFGARNGYEADANHELVALGAANLAAGLFSGYPVSSSASRTAVAEAAGTRTQLTAVVGAVAIGVLIVGAPGLLSALPQSVLGAVVIARPFACPVPPTGRSLDIRDFGATDGDASDDDASALRAALAAARPGDAVRIPAGTFRVSSGGITIPRGVSLVGSGRGVSMVETSIASVTPRLFLVDAGATDLWITDFAVRRAGGVPVQTVLQIGRGRWDSPTANEEFPLVQRVVVARLDISGHERMAVELENAQHVLVWDNLIHDAAALGTGGQGYGIVVSMDRSQDDWIVGNRVGPVIRHAYLLQYRASHNLLEHNQAEGTVQDAFDLHGEDESANELRSNTALDCARTDPYSGAVTYPAGFGVGESPNAGSGSGAAAHDVTGPRNWLRNNTVTACWAGIRVNNTDATRIEANVIRGAVWGIRIGDLNASAFSVVRWNRVTTSRTGIALGDADDTVVEGNAATDNTDYGLDLGSASARFVVTANDFRRNAVRRSSSVGVYAGNLE